MAYASWWTNDRVSATVTPDFVARKLSVTRKQRALAEASLHKPLSFGGDLTDETYIDWIVARGPKLFLILEEIGKSDAIFDAIDRSIDDGDLPLSEDEVMALNLSGGMGMSMTSVSLEKRFLKRQYFYLIKELEHGSHVDYGDEYIVPLEPIRTKLPSADENLDKVNVNNGIYYRRRVYLGPGSEIDRIHFVIHFSNLIKLSHPHIPTVFATYIQGQHGYVLFGPVLETTMGSFLTDPPKSFRRLTKWEKRSLFLRWMQCLASAVAYLHANGYAHQALRPSHVFITPSLDVHIGAYAALVSMDENGSSYDKEAYEYAAPEYWQKTALLHERSAHRSALPNGGRTSHRMKPTSTRGSFESQSGGAGFSGKIKSGLSSPLGPPHSFPFHEIPITLQNATDALFPIARMSSVVSDSSSETAPASRALVIAFAPSRLANPFPADIFSLGTLQVLLLSASLFVSSCSLSSLRNHLGKHHRKAGRGGAPADSSFHANVGQVESWLRKLEKAARKDDRGDGFGELVRDLAVIVRGVVRHDAERRWAGQEVADSSCEALRRWGVTVSRCCATGWDGERRRVHVGSDIEGGLSVTGRSPSPPLTEIDLAETASHRTLEETFDYRGIIPARLERVRHGINIGHVIPPDAHAYLFDERKAWDDQAEVEACCGGRCCSVIPSVEIAAGSITTIENYVDDSINGDRLPTISGSEISRSVTPSQDSGAGTIDSRIAQKWPLPHGRSTWLSLSRDSTFGRAPPKKLGQAPAAVTRTPATLGGRFDRPPLDLVGRGGPERTKGPSWPLPSLLLGSRMEPGVVG